jgi:hypothetical protein
MRTGDIEDNPVTQGTLAERVEAAFLQVIEQADAACSREWALHSIGQLFSRKPFQPMRDSLF